VNSIVPGAVMTARRRSFLEKWAPAHDMSVEDAMNKFPAESGISRYGQPEEVAELLGFMVSPAAKWMTGTSLRWMAERLKVFSGIPQAAEGRSYVRYRPGDRRPLGASFRHKRSTVPLIDGLLAAMAIHHNLTLVTRNTRDMARTRRRTFQSLVRQRPS
jgi:predicted nucleic acid-binding protein